MRSEHAHGIYHYIELNKNDQMRAWWFSAHPFRAIEGAVARAWDDDIWWRSGRTLAGERTYAVANLHSSGGIRLKMNRVVAGHATLPHIM
jgi:hypothetical protein